MTPQPSVRACSSRERSKGGPPRCAAPSGAGTASYKSPEQLADGRVTFRLCAPNAVAVAVGSSDNDDISPNTFGGGMGRPMAKDDLGLWSVTTPKPIAPDTYRYFFFVDGVRVADPAASEYSLERANLDSLVEVKATPRATIRHFITIFLTGAVAKVEYWSELAWRGAAHAHLHAPGL